MTVKEIVEKYLKDNGYEGLYNQDCGCELYDLMPCEGTMTVCFDCEAGHKIPCDPQTCMADGDCQWHIGEKK